MKLFFIDNYECRHIQDITKNVMKIYQLEQEFSPYLSVDFLTNKQYKPGIILILDNKVIYKNYLLNTQNEYDDLKNTIWDFFSKKYNVINDKNIDLRRYETNMVIQGWNNIINNAKNKKIIINEKNMNNNNDEYMKHPVYKLNINIPQNNDICFKTRYQECNDNYPQNTAAFKICTDNVRWLCDNGYPNHKEMILSQIIKNNMNNAKNELIMNNKINKQQYDNYILSGLFSQTNNRMSNKNYNTEINISDKAKSVDYYINFIEGFNTNENIYLLYIIIIIIILILCFNIIF